MRCRMDTFFGMAEETMDYPQQLEELRANNNKVQITHLKELINFRVTVCYPTSPSYKWKTNLMELCSAGNEYDKAAYRQKSSLYNWGFLSFPTK